MNLMQWNPFREMDNMLSHFSRGAGRMPALSDEAAAIADWAPIVDISENPKEYLVKAELPGVSKEDVDITSQNGVLTLSGERKFEKEDKDQKHHRIERAYGSFTRSFTIPEDVQADKITAECKDGVLCVHLPKSEVKAPKSTKIEVH